MLKMSLIPREILRFSREGLGGKRLVNTRRHGVLHVTQVLHSEG